MSERNKAAVRRFYEEIVTAGDLELAGEFMAEGLVDHEPGDPDRPEGLEGVKALFTMLREAFPDLEARVEDLIAEGDKVAARVTYTGTHEGAFRGVPASGNRMELTTIDVIRFADEKAVEHWGVADRLGLMQQLGAL